MNYFAHAVAFLESEDPCFVAGTAVPDWLTVADRQVRIRARHVRPAVDGPDPATAALAGGMLQHLLDDGRFHATRFFAETSLALSAASREVLRGDPGLRPAFLGHLLVEVLLDAALIAEEPGRLDRYHRLLDGVDAAWVQEAVNRLAPRPTVRLAMMICGFRRARILWDYLEDDKLLVRLNQVMRRVGLDPLPERFRDVLPGARDLVARRKGELLEGVPVRDHPLTRNPCEERESCVSE
jgi:hypothetical protein